MTDQTTAFFLVTNP